MAYPRIKRGSPVYAQGRLWRVLSLEIGASAHGSANFICAKESLFGHLISLFYRCLDWFMPQLVRFERKFRTGFVEGEIMPKTSVSYWIGSLYYFSNKFGYRINTEEISR